MNNAFINMIESAVTLAIFYLVYRFFLRKETFFRLNRIYLISSLLFSVTIPFINIQLNMFDDAHALNDAANQIINLRHGYHQLNAVMIYADSGIFTWNMLLDYITTIYFIGVLVALSFFLVGMIRIILMIRKSEAIDYKNYKIIKNKDIVVPFSLFKWIIINPEKHSSEDIEQIIFHEKMHAFQLHTFDLIFIEVLVILFWFNPFIYWYRKSIREVHEYLADRAVVENGFDRVDYQKLLLKQVSGYRFIGLTSSFSYSLSKNRLKMLTMMKSNKSSKIKLALAFPIVLIAIYFFANPVEMAKANNDLNKSLITQQDTTDVKLVKITSEGNQGKEITRDENGVYYAVEDMPKFQGKDSEAFRHYIAENLTYPADAAKNKIQGRVFISFTVDKDGNVTDVKVVRGVHPALDAEAKRVVESSPQWDPGKQDGDAVNVAFTFPIVFKLKK